MEQIAENLKIVREQIAAAAARASRDPATVKLVAVSKTKAPSMIREAFAAGQRVFGENYAQEMRDKARELADLSIEWHFIGHLQRNKAKYAVEAGAFIETVDSLELAQEISRQQGKRQGSFARPLPILLEVNIGDEGSKSGLRQEEIAELAGQISALGNLALKGLMVIPPYDPDPERSRPYFRRLHDILEELNRSTFAGKRLHELSMGMSHDYEAAVEEGATMVRVGTAIFGER